MKYRIVSEKYSYDLESHVNRLIDLGWRPKGGLVFAFSGMSDYYKQAMVKE